MCYQLGCLFAASEMVLQGLFRGDNPATPRTGVSECVREVLALNVNPDIGFGRMGEGSTNCTCGKARLIHRDELVEIRRLGDTS